MKLIYNGVDLAQLGELRILGHSTVREPAEAPQRERVTYRVRLDFFENTFRDNYGLIEQLRGALGRQQADLLWQEGSTTYVSRTVTAGTDELAEETGARGGNYWQAVVFQFWFYNHAVATQCLSASATVGLVTLDLGAVERWEERLEVTRWDELRAARKLVQGGLTASGRLQADTTQGVAQRQQALLALKDGLLAALVASASAQFQFGTFDKTIKVTHFRAEVDQPHNYIAWNLSATFTVYPNEADYAWLEVRIVRRENREEGIPRLTLSGRIGSPDLLKAQGRLALLQASLVPAGYVMTSEETTEPRHISESGSGGDGAIFTELGFSMEYRDASGKTCTFQRLPSGLKLDLGTVDKFREGYSVELFSELRPLRKRAGGTVTIGGKWFVGEGLSLAEKEKALVATKQAWDAEVVKGSSGALAYATVFAQTVRVLDFSAQPDRVKHFIDWSLTASWTRFPNEADYALCELRVTDRQDRAEGTVIKTLSGRIGAPTVEAAQAKLVRLRQALIPTGYVLKTTAGEESRVEVESDRKSGTDRGDGVSFLELSINEEWQKAVGQVLSWRVRRLPEQDPRSPWVKTTVSGTVTASGATGATALAVAQAMAVSLGDIPGSFRVRASVSETSFLVQTDGQVILTVEFAYEYQSKETGADVRIYTEVTGELSAETFGYTTETVSGSISAPTLALAQATYLASIRNTGAYQGALLLNERRLTLSQQRLATASAAVAAGDDRYTFSFQVLRPKSGTESALSYTLETNSNFQTMEKVTTVAGTVYAATEEVASGILDTLMATLTLGKRLRARRSVRKQQGPTVGGGGAQTQGSGGMVGQWFGGPPAGGSSVQPVVVFLALDFTEDWMDLLTGVEGLLECECSEEVTYPGQRIVVKPIPDGSPVIQQPGQTDGRRTVTARALGTTESACRAWVLGMGSALLTGSGIEGVAYVYPPHINTSFRFLPQTSGVARGEGSNVKVAEVSGTFSEVLLVGTP